MSTTRQAGWVCLLDADFHETTLGPGRVVWVALRDLQPGGGVRQRRGVDPTPSDAELITRSIKQPAAFDAVFDRHYDAVCAFAMRRLGASEGEEAAAETFSRAFARRGSFLGADSALPWLLGICANVIRMSRRSEARRLRAYARSPRDLTASDEGERADRVMDAVPLARSVAQALASARPVERDVLLLHAWADLSYEEIALALDVPIGTVRSHLSRARARLRKTLTSEVASRPICVIEGDRDG